MDATHEGIPKQTPRRWVEEVEEVLVEMNTKMLVIKEKSVAVRFIVRKCQKNSMDDEFLIGQ